MPEKLYSLEEISLKVRDLNSKTYIEEAIGAYRAGANRSALISTWIAVTYDLIQKIRELANTREAAAIQFIDEFDKAVENQNIPKLLQLEDGLIERARDTFEILQPHEATALLRIKEDRHLCAHPAMISGDILFQPTSEVLQSHIVHAIIYLLQHSPVQGKSALDRMLADVQSTSFPTEVDAASVFLYERYLKRAKSSLSRNWIITLLKTILFEPTTKDTSSFDIALRASLKTINADCIKILKENIAKITARCTDDTSLLMVLCIIDIEPECWLWIEEDLKIQLIELLKNGRLLQQYSQKMINGAMKVNDLADMVNIWLESSDDSVNMHFLSHFPMPRFIPRAFNLYERVRNFADANLISSTIIAPLVENFSEQDVSHLLEIVKDNDQIHYGNLTQDLLLQAFDKTSTKYPNTKDNWKIFIKEIREKTRPDYFLTLAKKISPDEQTSTTDELL